MIDSVNQTISTLTDDFKKEERLFAVDLNDEKDILWNCYIEYEENIWVKRVVDDTFFEKWWTKFQLKFKTLDGLKHKKFAMEKKWVSHHDVLRYLASHKSRIVTFSIDDIGCIHYDILHSDEHAILFTGIVPSHSSYDDHVLVLRY